MAYRLLPQKAEVPTLPPVMELPKSRTVADRSARCQSKPGSVEEAIAEASQAASGCEVRRGQAARRPKRNSSRTRLLVTQADHECLRQRWNRRKPAMKLAEAQHARIVELRKAGTIPESEAAKTESDLLTARSDLGRRGGRPCTPPRAATQAKPGGPALADGGPCPSRRPPRT